MTDCIEWTGRTNNKGYGVEVVWDGQRNVTRLVHRHAWETERGPIPKGHYVLHSCDNPPCYNVAHLMCVTQGENLQDMVAKGRSHHQQKTHCGACGADLTDPKNLTTNKRGRECRRCRNKWQRESRQRRRARDRQG